MANTPTFDLDAFGNVPMNCMTLIAGRAASATGHVLVGHNEDDGGHIVVRHGYVRPRDWAAGGGCGVFHSMLRLRRSSLQVENSVSHCMGAILSG